jgi:hypothetical protein
MLVRAGYSDIARKVDPRLVALRLAEVRAWTVTIARNKGNYD